MHELYIDYLVASQAVDERKIIMSGAESIHPIAFFKRGYLDQLGKRYYFGHRKTDNANVVMSGSYMHNSRVVGWSDRECAREIIDNGGTIKRMDVAITDYITDDIVTPKCIAKEYAKNRIVGAMAEYPAKTISSIDDKVKGRIETTYIGDLSRRGKKGVFRAYDKGLELGIMRDIITRLELEERGDNAHMSAVRFADGSSLSSVIDSRLKFTGKRMQRFFTDEPIDLSRGDNVKVDTEEERMSKRYEWLMHQVAPALREFTQYERENGKSSKKTMDFLRKSGIIE